MTRSKEAGNDNVWQVPPPRNGHLADLFSTSSLGEVVIQGRVGTCGDSINRSLQCEIHQARDRQQANCCSAGASTLVSEGVDRPLWGPE